MKHWVWIALTAALSAAGEPITGISIFPVDFQRGIYHVTENYPYVLIPQFTGDRNAVWSRPLEFMIELPEAVKVIRACSRIGRQKNFAFRFERIVRAREKLRRWRIDIPNCINPSGGWRAGFYLYVQADKGSAGLSVPVRYEFSHPGKTLKAGQFILNILPEMRTPEKPLQDFALSIHYCTGEGNEDDSILKEQLAFWTALSRRPYHSFNWEHYQMPQGNIALLDRNCRLMAETWACEHSTMVMQDSGCDDLGFFVHHRVTRPGVPLFVDRNGKADPTAICPQYLMKDPEGLFYNDYLRRSVEKMRRHAPGINTFVIDYEPRAEGGTCDSCRKDFARFARLSRVPSRGELLPGNPLNRKWKEYKIHQNHIIIGNVIRGVRKHFPGMKFSLCCSGVYPPDEVINNWDAVDASALESQIDYLSIMNYCAGKSYYDHLKYAVGHLKHAKVFPWIDPTEELERYFIRYSPKKIRQNIIASIALNAMGIMFYPNDSMDGAVLNMINETGIALAGVEDIYLGNDLSGKVRWQTVNARKMNLFNDRGIFTEVEYPALTSQIRVHLHEKNGRYALSLLNYASETGFLKIAIPDYSGSDRPVVADLIHRQQYSGLTGRDLKNGFLVKVPAKDCAVIRISAEKCSYPAVSEKQMAADLARPRENPDQHNKFFHSRQFRDRGLQWRLFKKIPMLTLVNGENYVTINPGENARIEEWCKEKYIRVGRPRGMLGEMILYDLRQSAVHEYRLADVRLDAPQPCVILRSIIPQGTSAVGGGNPLVGLILEKQIALDQAGNIRIADIFRNPTSKSMRFGFRMKHIPYSVWEAKCNYHPQVEIDGKRVLPGMYIRKGAQLNWIFAKGAKEYPVGNQTVLKYGNVAIRFVCPGNAGFYYWKNLLLHTVEPLYEDITLKPGESRKFIQEIFRENQGQGNEQKM